MRGAGRLAGPLLVASLAASLAPRVALAHVGLAPAPHDVWTHWGASPVEVLLLTLPAAWYAVGVRALWRSAGVGHGVTRAAAARFGLGMLVLWIALLSPLDAMADALFSAHMLQHMLLILAAAPLLVAGAPLVPMLWALPRAARRSSGRWWAGRPAARAAVDALLSPLVVFALHALAIWFWHAPGPYQAALARPWVHALEHASFLLTACAFWWVVAPPVGRRCAHAPALLLVVGTLAQTGALGAILTLSVAPWYPAHAAGARAWDTTLLGDQQLAGLLMWVPAGFVYVAAAARLFLRWMADDARRHAAPPDAVRPRAMEGIA